jgi:hypothetical protein
MAVPNRCLELNLDHRLVQLGEQFLTDGDLRAFLQAANQVNRIYDLAFGSMSLGCWLR